MNYDMNYEQLPEHIRHGFQAYIEEHREPGDFVMACLENNLCEACGRADETNRERMFDIVSFLYNEAPAECWGSSAKVEAWLAERVRDETPS